MKLNTKAAIAAVACLSSGIASAGTELDITLSTMTGSHSQMLRQVDSNERLVFDARLSHSLSDKTSVVCQHISIVNVDDYDRGINLCGFSKKFDLF